MLEAFLEQLHDEVFDEAHDDEQGGLRLTSFVKVILDRLADAGILEEGQVAFCKHDASTPHGEVHGYAYDAEEDVLALFYFIDANEDTSIGTHLEIANVGKEAIERGFRRLEGFVRQAKAQRIAGLDESQPAYELVQLVRESAKARRAIALNVLTTGKVSDKAATSSAKDGFSRDVWDILRLSRTCGGTGDDKLSIDFDADFQQTLPCLVTEKAADGIQVLFTCIPGSMLAQIYNTYRARLLERNVRSFLQFTGKVNKGIRTTVLNEPSRFLPYNNGLSATASSVILEEVKGGTARIRRIEDFQIVNGGQTTASVAACVRRDAADLSRVSVAMKVTIVPEGEVDRLVPLISKYANTQNRIQEADFSANHPWHIELERLSRHTWTRATSEAPRGTRWFYERSRGQYADSLAAESTAAGRKRFRSENPSPQKFSKTDLAKFMLSWDQLPHAVSKGAQKCFVDFMNQIRRDDRKPADEAEFRRIIALGILFHTAEKLYGQMNYQGYRAQVVTYAVARLSYALQRRLPWKEMWETQRLPMDFVQPLKTILTAARGVIVQPPGGRNVTEWCKRAECWSAVLSLVLDLGFPTVEAEEDQGKDAVRPIVLTAQERTLVDTIREVKPEIWSAVASWARSTNTLTATQRKVSDALGKPAFQNGRLTPSVAKHAAALLLEATRLGYGHASLSSQLVQRISKLT